MEIIYMEMQVLIDEHNMSLERQGKATAAVQLEGQTADFLANHECYRDGKKTEREKHFLSPAVGGGQHAAHAVY